VIISIKRLIAFFRLGYYTDVLLVSESVNRSRGKEAEGKKQRKRRGGKLWK
jgi:hypothetical protein